MATLQLWLPCLVLAHVFALFWLIKAFVRSYHQHRKAVKVAADDPRGVHSSIQKVQRDGLADACAATHQSLSEFCGALIMLLWVSS